MPATPQQQSNGPKTGPTPISNCNHPPVMAPDMHGVINPLLHFGDGMDGYVTCIMCKNIVGDVNPKTHRIEWR